MINAIVGICTILGSFVVLIGIRMLDLNGFLTFILAAVTVLLAVYLLARIGVRNAAIVEEGSGK